MNENDNVAKFNMCLHQGIEAFQQMQNECHRHQNEVERLQTIVAEIRNDKAKLVSFICFWYLLRSELGIRNAKRLRTSHSLSFCHFCVANRAVQHRKLKNRHFGIDIKFENADIDINFENDDFDISAKTKKCVFRRKIFFEMKKRKGSKNAYQYLKAQ